MGYDFDNDTPIYLQIIEHIKMQIINKEFLPNDKLPSVRELSFQYGVNPNTIQKALQELEDIGLIFTERTNGKFVTSNLEIIEKIRQETIDNIIDDFFDSMLKLGLSRNDVMKILNKR
ncbi:MAG: GntR family transcriptional regulator [Clostridia bacterium]|nr:GntR family transcriptional regulator [Clostridia bacterium]